MKHTIANARGAMSGADNAPAMQYLTFFIGGEEYGVPILRAREIIALTTLTRVPAVPPCIRGVINLRGSVVPVADLAIKFGQPEWPITRRTCIVVVEAMIEQELTPIGLLVESVNRTVQLGSAEIEPAPPFGTRALSKFLSGLGKIDKTFLLLLDIDQALSASELLSAFEKPKAGEIQGPPETDSVIRSS
jgi:purine-binding chemotaxis protein CheW